MPELVEATPSPNPPRSVAKVGDAIVLKGFEDEVMEVLVTKLVDPAVAAEYSEPSAGTRFVAVQFKLHNVGTNTYNDSPSNGATLVDTTGQRFNSTYAETKAGVAFPGSVTIAPGDFALGFLTFEVPKSSKIAKVQFTLNSGFADQTGQWEIQ